MFASFVFAQLLAVAAGTRFLAQPETYQQFDNPGDVSHSIVFFGYVLLSALVLLLVLKYYHGNAFFLIVELFLLFFALWILLELALPSVYALGVAILVVGFRLAVPRAREFLLLVATSVVGALIGTWLDLLPAAIFTVLLSGYDLVAVFYTKHMIALAKGLDSRGASFSIQFSSGEASKVRSAKASMGPAVSKRVVRRRPQGSVELIELGTGDIVIPAMLTVAALKISFYAAAASLAGSVAGLLLLFYLLEKRRGYWPALPPIAGCTLAAIVLYLLYSGGLVSVWG